MNRSTNASHSAYDANAGGAPLRGSSASDRPRGSTRSLCPRRPGTANSRTARARPAATAGSTRAPAGRRRRRASRRGRGARSRPGAAPVGPRTRPSRGSAARARPRAPRRADGCVPAAASRARLGGDLGAPRPQRADARSASCRVRAHVGVQLDDRGVQLGLEPPRRSGLGGGEQPRPRPARRDVSASRSMTSSSTPSESGVLSPQWASITSLDAVDGPARGFPRVVRRAGAERGLVRHDARIAPDLLRTPGVTQQVRVVALLPDEDQVRGRHELGDERAALGGARERIGRDAEPPAVVLASSSHSSSSSVRCSSQR